MSKTAGSSQASAKGSWVLDLGFRVLWLGVCEIQVPAHLSHIRSLRDVSTCSLRHRLCVGVSGVSLKDSVEICCRGLNLQGYKTGVQNLQEYVAGLRV